MPNGTAPREPIPPATDGPACLTVTMPRKTLETIRQISRDLGLSDEQILILGVGLAEMAVNAHEQGKKFGVVGADGQLETEVVPG